MSRTIENELLLSILLVDDDYSVRECLRTVLEREGFAVDEAANGDIALKILKRQFYDLAIIDIFMPEKEGLSTIADLQKEYPDLKIIAISGVYYTDRPDYLSMAKLFGASQILYKPISKYNLIETVLSTINPNSISKN